MSAETENTIRVVLRTRPTQNFASKNLGLDIMDNVKIKYLPNII
jgi:hypothetical protein